MREIVLSDLRSIPVNLTEDERIEAVRLTAQCVNQPEGASRWKSALIWLFIFLVFAIAGYTHFPGGELIPFVLLIFFGVFYSVYHRNYLFRKIARRQLATYSLDFSDEGIRVSHQNGEARIMWQMVDSLTINEDVLFFYLNNFEVLSFPLRHLPVDIQKEDFIHELEHVSGRQVLQKVSIKPNHITHSSDFFLSDLSNNVVSGGLFYISPQRAMGKLRASTSQVIALSILIFVLILVGDWLLVGIDSDFNLAGVPNALFNVPLLLLVGWLSAKAAGDESRFVPGVVALLNVGVVSSFVTYMMMLLAENGLMPGSGTYYKEITWVVFVWVTLTMIRALIKAQKIRLPEQRIVAVVAVLGLLIYPKWELSHLYFERLWTIPYDESEYAQWKETQNRVTNEKIFYIQPKLLNTALEMIPQGRKGVPEFYAVSLGGYGDQDVFLREVMKTDSLFHTRFDALGHVVLVNNPATIETHPIASMTALKQTLKEIGERMDREEDVLLLFMTSHGASDFEFSLELWPYQFDSLTPDTLKAALDDAGILYRVIVVSACYSGGFVEKMADSNTLIMSASRADLNSHGCSHDAEWTFFGQALFADALNQTFSFEEAFEIASELVAKREHEEGYEASEPQIAVGESVRPVLREIEQRLQHRKLTKQEKSYSEVNQD